MTQKILCARTGDPSLATEQVLVHADQIVLARAASRALGEAIAAGMKKTSAEVAIAYDGRCVTDATPGVDARMASVETLSHGVLVARAGAGSRRRCTSSASRARRASA